MKKLMTVIASVALAFGLHAADDFVFNQTDFSASTLKPGPLNIKLDDEGLDSGTLYWAGDAGDSEIKEAEDATKFLAIENSAPLFRTVNGQTADPQEIGTGVFADMYVKFTASDAADPIVLADGSKLGIWVAADDEAETPTTNLMVCAASLVAGAETPVATNFTIALDADFDFKAEHRVTIRAIEEISEGKLKMAGFVLYIDEELVAAADSDYADKIGFTAFNSVAKPFYDNNQLFVSLVEAGTDDAQTIFGVGFKGTGELSKVALADADHAPDFAKPAVDVTFEWADGVESFTYQGIATNVGGKAGSVVVTLAGPTVPVTLSGVTASDGYVLGDIEAENLNEVEDGVWSFVEAPASLKMTAGEVAFTIGDKKYATFEDALAEADGETIKLAKNFAPEDELSIGEDVAIDFTLDLAGNDIVVGEDYSETDIFWIMEGSSLTFIDSIGGGEVITEGAESLESVFYSDGQLYVGLDDGDEGVTVNGTLEGGNAPVIVKGNFDKAGNGEDEFAYTIDTETYEVVDTVMDGYWTVRKQGVTPNFVIEIVGGDKYETIDEALEDATDGDELKLLKSVTLDDTLVIDKAIKFEMDGNEIKLAADKAIGIDVKAAATIQDGDITSTRETYANNAYMILNEAVDATYKNLNVYAANYKFGLTCDSPGDLADECENAPTVTVTCENVDIIGNGTLFYAQHTILNLDAYCSATKDPTLTSGGYAAAVYSALNATVTLAGDDKTGGAYEHDYALISGNLGGQIIVNGGAFKGDIKSYMKVGAHTELEELDGYKAKFIFNGGTYDGEIVFEDDSDEARELDSFWKNDAVTLTAPDGYKWDAAGFLVKDVEPETYDITITAPENGTLETSVTNGVAAGTEVTVTATPAEGYELESITTNGQVLAGTTFEMPAEDVTVAATFKQVGGYPPEWPKTDEDTKAKFAAWVAGKGADADLSTDDAKDAFLLNCTVKGLKDAKDAFKITSIEFVEGAWVIGEPEGDFNGKVVTKAFDAVVDGKEVTEPTGEETELFWKAFLVFPPAAE